MTISVNQPLRTMLKGFSPKDRFPAIVVITVPGCHACEMAKAAMDKSGLVYKEIEPCSVFTTLDCFDPGDRSLATPTFLVVDANEVVRRTFVGWSGSSTLSTLNDLASAMKETR
jgi:hypothetical protein